MDSTILISKYLKEYNCLYKEANEIYHETACSVISARLPACQNRRLIHPSENCRPTDISLFLLEKDGVCISILQLPARS